MASILFGGGAITLGTGPGVTVGTPQEFSLDIDGDVIELFGANQFAVDVASGKKKVSLKFKAGEVQNDALAKLLGGSVASNGTYALDNSAMGSTTPFPVSWAVTYLSKTYTFTMLACVFKKWSVTGGNDKHALVDAELSCFADATNHIATFAAASA